ncbi:MAG: hypothetical protein HOA17_03365 [Candidatus Melainabacteria bacterium]|jgi:hypothetical protein|nr:hypothetical protein [Candidatus Melainabacteria bacterium]
MSSWGTMTLLEQLGNIGSEVERYASWKSKAKLERANNAFYRAVDLFNASLNDERWPLYRKKEIGRLKESFCDTVYGAKLYGAPIEYFQKYFLQCAIAAKNTKVNG